MVRGMMRFALAVLLFTACVLPVGADPVRESPVRVQAGEPQALATETITILSGSVRHRFEVEIADTDAARMRGLMFRDSLDEDKGMLFLFDDIRMRSFWMRNTFISLDILFISPDGRIVTIARETTPRSDESIPSRGPVNGVLEIGGGLSDHLGIKEGDLVEHAHFGTARKVEPISEGAAE